jgi:D-alanyl-D-alanine carboxypeptidase (penicillin-binding protein 5/6)
MMNQCHRTHRIATRHVALLLACAITVVPALSQAAPAAPAGAGKSAEETLQQASDIRAEAAILGDLDTGLVMLEQAPDVRRDPASLTKVMTLYLVFDALSRGALTLESKLPVSERAWRTGGSKTFVRVGEMVSVQDLLLGIAVQSGNDACMVVAEHIGGSEKGFADMMNQKARLLGMQNSHFMNSSGLPDPDHYSSARDLFLLARAVVTEFPQYTHIFQEKHYTFNGIKQYNRNRLLWRDPHFTGMKTGHTQTSGYCLIATSAREGQRLGAVLLGTKSAKIREEEAVRLLNYGSRMYETVHIYEKGATIRQFRVWKGDRDLVDGVVDKPVLVAVSRRDRGKLEVGLKYNDPLVAPINQGDRIGSLMVKLGEQELINQPVVAGQVIQEAGFIGRMVDSLKMRFGWK